MSYPVPFASNMAMHKKKKYLFQENQSATTKQVEDEHAQHLSVLQDQLSDQLEQLQKYKINTELDIQHKAKELINCRGIIESQRKASSNLQLENEKLKSRLNEEMEDNQEILQKMESNRRLCISLKEDVDNLNGVIKTNEIKYKKVCEEDEIRSELIKDIYESIKDLKAKSKNDYQEILDQSQKQEESYEKWIEHLKTQLQNVRSELERNTTIMEINSNNLKSQLKHVEEEKELFRLEVMKLKDLTEKQSAELTQRLDRCCILEKKQEDLQHALQEKAASFENAEIEIKNLNGQLKMAKDAFDIELEEMSNLAKTNKSLFELEKNNAENYCSQYGLASEKISHLTASSDALATKVNNYEGKLKDMDVLMKDVEYLKQELQRAKESEANMKTRLQKNEINEHTLSTNLESALIEKKNLQEETELLHENIKCLEEEIQVCRLDFTKSDQDKKEENGSLKTEIDDLKSNLIREKKKFEAAVKLHEDELNDLKSKLKQKEFLSSNLEATHKSVVEEIAKNKETTNELKDELKTMTEEKEKTEAVHLSEISQMWDLLNKTTANLQDDIKVKNERIVELKDSSLAKTNEIKKLREDLKSLETSETVTKNKRTLYSLKEDMIISSPFEIHAQSPGTKHPMPRIPCYTPVKRLQTAAGAIPFCSLRSDVATTPACPTIKKDLTPVPAVKKQVLFSAKNQAYSCGSESSFTFELEDIMKMANRTRTPRKTKAKTPPSRSASRRNTPKSKAESKKEDQKSKLVAPSRRKTYTRTTPSPAKAKARKNQINDFWFDDIE